jgi:hypothetical protein
LAEEIKKITANCDEQNEIMKKIIVAIFGDYSVELDFSRWNIELPQVIIKDVDFNEDLLTVLQRLRTFFWVRIIDDICDCNACEKGEHPPSSQLNIELIMRD